ncbi:MAG: T9SS type A sorting domain-containing protein, partial [Chitinophagaceae bacterium]
VIVQDGCYRDSAFFKDKTSAGGSELNPFAWHCNTFDIHADGNNYDTVCLWNATTNTLVGCKKWTDTSINPNTGQPWPYGGAEWYGLPYGSYYAFIYDPCLDTLVRIDTTVTYPKKSHSDVYPSCMVMQSAVAVYFAPEAPMPRTTYVYWPNDSLVATFQSSGGNWQHHYPTYPQPGLIKVVTEDGCGIRDTSYITQLPLYPVRRLETKGGCPGPSGESGSADILLYGSAGAYAGQGNGAPVGSIKIIKKDSAAVSIPQNYTIWNGSEQIYYFTNLSTGTYVLESTIGCAGYKVYDTVTVKPYVYPLQEQTHITQCGTNSFAFKDSVIGGIAPFTYEILATVPNLPSLLTGTQLSNTFIIPPGAGLDTIKMRVMDACGNAHVKNFPVSHLASCLPLDVVSDPEKQNKPEGLIAVFPNPSRNEFFIKFAKKKKTTYRIELTNSVGVKLYTASIENVDLQMHRINRPFTPGIYFIHVTDIKTNKTETFKQLIL